jgi:hypothetical protein
LGGGGVGGLRFFAAGFCFFAEVDLCFVTGFLIPRPV